MSRVRWAGVVAPVDEPSAGGAGRGFCPAGALQRLRQAAEVLCEQLTRPGGYRRAWAATRAERLTGVPLGATQEEALLPSQTPRTPQPSSCHQE